VIEKLDIQCACVHGVHQQHITGGLDDLRGNGKRGFFRADQRNVGPTLKGASERIAYKSMAAQQETLIGMRGLVIIDLVVVAGWIHNSVLASMANVFFPSVLGSGAGKGTWGYLSKVTVAIASILQYFSGASLCKVHCGPSFLTYSETNILDIEWSSGPDLMRLLQSLQFSCS
jgi:hypothetical protein